MIRVCTAALLVLAGALASAQDPADDAAILWSEATLYRDDWGVPHIYADNPRAMAFAFGYAQAEDHLVPMLLAYRLANGRASEVLGPEAEEADRLSIRLNHAGLAYNAYELADAVTRDLCEGFALGVNTWITEHPDAEPAWKDGVQPADVLALLHRYLLGQAPFDYPGAPHLARSTPSANAWAVGPALSQTREPMLVINPHADFEGAYQWYEAHLVTPDLNIYGATLFGLPVIVQGHNALLGWALAPNAPDIADVFVEYGEPGTPGDPNSTIPEVRAGQPGGVIFTEDENRGFYIKTPNGFAENTEERLATPHGPVVASAEGRLLSWQAGGYRDFGALRQLYDMGRAQDLDEFRRVLDRLQLSTFHVVYADAAGNIFYRYNATTGLRVDAATASADAGFGTEGLAENFFEAPVASLDHRFEWGAALTPDALPWILNPASGYVQACGTPPWLATVPAVLDPSAWPAWLIRDQDSYRAKRVRRLFSIGPRSFEDMQAMLFDTVSPLAAEAVPYLLALAEENPDYVDNAHPDLRVLLDILREWNYLAETGSTAMTAFHVWWSILQLDEDGASRPNEIIHRLIQENAPWFQEWTLESAAQAAQLLRNEYQTLSIAWGDVHAIVRGDKEFPLAGGHSGDPIFYTGDRRFDDGKWRVNEGYGFAMAVRFGETPEAVSLVPFGSSENPSSTHYDDQLQLMLSRRFKVTRYDREDLERHTESATGRRLLLRPGRQSASVFLTADTPMIARLKESATPPAALPEGLAAFTTYLEPTVEGAPEGLSVEFDLRVNETVCDTKDLESVFLYGYHPVDGWRQIEDQTLDGERRAMTALLTRCEVVAALGPESARRADPALVRAPETRRAPSGARLAGADAAANDATPAAQNDDASVIDLDPADEERVATLTPPAPRVLTPSDDLGQYRQQLPENIRPGQPMVITPAVPPGFKPEPLFPTTPVFVPSEAKPVTIFNPQFFGVAPAEQDPPSEETPAPETAAQEPSPKLSTEDLAPAAASSADAPPRQPGTATASPRPEPAPIAGLPAGAPKHGVSFSSQTPAEMVGRKGPKTVTGLDLAPDPARASPLQIGQKLEMRTPDGAAVFTMRTQENTRAQAFLRTAPPAPYPAGLTAFSEVYEVMADPAPASADTAISIRIQPGTVTPDRFGDLELYAYDSVQGWKPFEKQRASVESFSLSTMDFRFSAMDGGSRIYAVLGPADAVRTR